MSRCLPILLEPKVARISAGAIAVDAASTTGASWMTSGDSIWMSIVSGKLYSSGEIETFLQLCFERTEADEHPTNGIHGILSGLLSWWGWERINHL